MAKCIGFDIGTHSIKAVELSGKGGVADITNTYVLQTPPNIINGGTIVDYSELSTLVRKVHNSGGFSKSAAALAIKGGSSVVKGTRVPFINEQQLLNNVYFLAEQYLNVNPFEYAVDYKITHIDKVSSIANVVYTANRHDALSDYMSVFKSANMVLDNIDMEMTALCELYNYLRLPTRNTSLIIHIGYSCLINIFVSNGAFAYYELAMSGGQRCSEVIVKNTYVSEDDVESAKIDFANHKDAEEIKKAITVNYLPDLLNEISKSLHTYMLLGGGSVDRIYLSGGGATTYGLADAMKDKFRISAELLNPANAFKISNGVAKQILTTSPTILNTAIAMAMR